MDYNACKCALTLDQASRMHNWLHTTGAVHVASGAYTGQNMAGTIISSGYSGPLNCCSQNIGVSSATVNISAPTGTTFTWTKTNGTGNFYAFPGGTMLNLTDLGTVNLKVVFTSNCVSVTKNFSFYNSGSYYTVSPNPTTGDLLVEVTSEEELEELINQETGEPVNTFMQTVTLRDHAGKIVFKDTPGKRETTFHKNISHLEAGTYFLEIRSGKILVEKTIVKV